MFVESAVGLSERRDANGRRHGDSDLRVSCGSVSRPGLTWFEIDVLLFDEQFLSVLAAISSALAD